MIVIILAGGLGKRMESSLPKVLHKVVLPLDVSEEYPMLVHVIMTAMQLNPEKIYVVVGKFKQIISQTVGQYIQKSIPIEYVDQEPALGTGHAVKCALETIGFNYEPDTQTLILSGDVPLMTPDTLKNMTGSNNKLLITKLDEPFGCGRIIFDDGSHNVLKIIEEKDCTDEERKIQYVNCGIYQIKLGVLRDLIPMISNCNKAGEYYLTDIVGLMGVHGIPVDACLLENEQHWEIANVNTKKDLEKLNNFVFEKFKK